jgi:hypothetical protein
MSVFAYAAQAPQSSFWKNANETEPEHVANEFTISYVHAFASHYAKEKYFPRTYRELRLDALKLDTQT